MWVSNSHFSGSPPNDCDPLGFMQLCRNAHDLYYYFAFLEG